MLRMLAVCQSLALLLVSSLSQQEIKPKEILHIYTELQLNGCPLEDQDIDLIIDLSRNDEMVKDTSRV